VYKDRYRAAFAALGCPLKPEHGISVAMLEHFTVDGLTLPPALRDYYHVAGLGGRLNTSFNRLLSLEDLFSDAGRIVFMEENQGVVYWGVPADPLEVDPPVQQGVNTNGNLEWHDEAPSCADFLETMLYWQASFGEGLKHLGTADVPTDFETRLEGNWRFVGSIGELRAYGQQDCALSFLEWEAGDYRVLGGFHTKKQMLRAAKELKLRWEEL
jgi:hypothetical protein